MYNAPYGDTQQLNLDWFIKRWKEFYAEWEAAEAGIDHALDAEIQRVEDAMQDLYAARDAAAASATAAAASASSASNSATTATNAASAAAASATLANNKATAAGLSEASAAQSATNAGNSASSAATSASQANASAASATTDAQSATASATAAAASAQRAEDAAQAGGVVKSVENVPIASVDDALAENAVELVVGIDPVQAGTGDPSPDNVRAITGWTGANVVRTGVNLFDKTTVQNGYIDNADGEVKAISTSFNYKCTDFIRVESNESYYIKSEQTGAIWGAFYDKNKKFITGITGYNNAVKTAPQNAYYARFTVSSILTGNVDTFAVNYPSTDTSYHAYSGQTIPITFPDAAGTVYGAKLINDGTGTWKLRVDKVGITFDGSDDESWRLTGTTRQYFDIAVPNFKNPASTYYAPNMISSSYRIVSINAADASSDIVTSGYNGAIRVYDVAAYETLENWKAHLAQDPLQIVYELATPVEYTFTTAEIIRLLTGYNNIWADTGNVDLLRYYVNSKGYIDAQDALVKALIAKELDEMKADTALTVNDFRIVNNTLYRITASVASGATLTPNTNCTATTVSEVLKTLLT